MSLSAFLCQLHEVNCSFRVSQSEVHDIESAVLEGLSFILDKGQTLKIEPFRLGAKSTPASEEGRIVSYGDLFAVEKSYLLEVSMKELKIRFPTSSTLTSRLMLAKLIFTKGADRVVYGSRLNVAARKCLRTFPIGFLECLKQR